MRPLRTIAVFPTMFTLGNLACGFFAIVVAARVIAPTTLAEITPQTEPILTWPISSVPGQLDRNDPTQNIMLSSWLIFLAMVFDALDGRVARMANQTSKFGAELDSLCDLVTFGVAPAFLMVKMCPGFALDHRNIVWIIAATFAMCAALRLARFNVETSDDEDDHQWFNGLPAPAAAAAIAGFALVFYSLRSAPEHRIAIDEWFQWVLPAFALVLSLLMVSRIPYPHAINQFVRGQRSFAHVVAIIFALIPVVVAPGFSIPGLVALYVLTPPFIYLSQLVLAEISRRTGGLKRNTGEH
ncbi:MAG: CDP-diacylglycerol--serine O-phosphatidyltransferase [Pirellulales bacterium]